MSTSSRSSPDERASIKIDVIREVLERTAFRPFEGRRRMVHRPRCGDAGDWRPRTRCSSRSKSRRRARSFVLTTAVPSALLPTVQSRCMRLRFGRLTEREVAEVLVRDHGMDERDARAAAALADGRVGEALALGVDRRRHLARGGAAAAAAGGGDARRRRVDCRRQPRLSTGAVAQGTAAGRCGAAAADAGVDAARHRAAQQRRRYVACWPIRSSADELAAVTRRLRRRIVHAMPLSPSIAPSWRSIAMPARKW